MKTVSLMLTFLLALVLYPDVQAKAQDELYRMMKEQPSFVQGPANSAIH